MRARDGDLEAFTELVSRHQGAAHRVAFVITRSVDDADDALQEGLMKAYRALGRFRIGAPFRPWLTTIVANQARNRARSARRAEALADRLAVVQERRTPDTPESEVIAQETQRRLLQLVDALPEKLRRAVTLRHLVGLSEAETAAALGVSPGTVKSRVSRGLTRLRDEMGKDDATP